MTREEAIDIIKKYDINGCGYCHQGGDEVEEAFNMAIKALEQESIIDKIRAEIERKAHSGQWSDATMYGMLKAVAIIDKYKAEGRISNESI
jgi:hypothetical protein